MSHKNISSGDSIIAPDDWLNERNVRHRHRTQNSLSKLLLSATFEFVTLEFQRWELKECLGTAVICQIFGEASICDKKMFSAAKQIHRRVEDQKSMSSSFLM